MARTSTSRKSKTRSKTRSAPRGSRKAKKMPKRRSASSKKKARKSKTKGKSRPTRASARSRTRASSTRKTPETQTQTTEAVETSRVGVGDQAPDFTLPDQNGNPVTLSQLRGQKVVLYFYPKDDTPGCTLEACSFRDNIAQFNGVDAVVLGVSFDDQNSHQKFIEKYGLNFQLLSDTNKEVAQKYGVYVQKNMYGNLTWGIQRSTFIIDREGTIAAEWRKVSVDGHVPEVLEALQSVS